MKPFTLAVCWIALCLGHSATASLMVSPTWGDLTAEDQQKVTAGQLVELYRNYEGNSIVWPRSTFFKKIDATPEEAVALFFDFNHHSDFLPFVLSSEILNETGNSAEVDYKVTLPSFPYGLAQEGYTLNYRVNSYDHNNIYSVSWHMTRSGGFTGYSEGSFTAKPLVGGGTLVIYDQFAQPRSGMSSLVHQHQVVEMEKVTQKVTALILFARIEKEGALHSVLLSEQVQALRQVLQSSSSNEYPF
ncbi:MAG: hypothetical protein ACO3A2_09040 [Bdellovibrionia bacterium]